jgi:anti-sigma-K factor RskA
MSMDRDPPMDEDRPDDVLAGEFVLGVLEADERAAVQRRIDDDPAFATLVHNWEESLDPLAAEYEPVEAPAHVRDAVEARLFTGSENTAVSRGFWQSVTLWRGLALASMLLLAVLGTVLVTGEQKDAGGDRLLASLSAEGSASRFVAFYEQATRTMHLSPVAVEAQPNRDMELWIIPAGGAPISLGVVPASGQAVIPVQGDLQQHFAAGATFAVSREPKGGSPTGSPTGPVIAAGLAKEI